MFFEISEKIKKAAQKAQDMCELELKKVDEMAEYNQQKVLKAFIDNKVSERHFAGSTGYGYGDDGREALERVLAQIFNAEDAVIRHNFVSGTHALTVALFGVLRPGDTVMSVTGAPYDTLQGVIGATRASSGSLKEFGINYAEIPLALDGAMDFSAIEKNIKNDTKMVYMQRSRGYAMRRALPVTDIRKVARLAKKIAPKCVVMLDNCYGEFVGCDEPLQNGVDLIAGSLIKNPGGGLAPTGGYIAGRRDLVEMCSYRLTTPGTGKEVGATLGLNKALFMGLFNAPHVTGEALKTAIFSAALFELLGYEVFPRYNEPRGDIVQAIKLGNAENLILFCQSIQAVSPVDSFVKPEPWDMPGYDNKIIMAAGTFTQGASIELSADAPLREPYAVFLQGGLNFHSAKVAVIKAADEVLKNRTKTAT